MGSGGGRPSLASRVVKSNQPVGNSQSTNCRSSSGGRFSTGQGSNNHCSAGSSRSSSVGRSAGNNQQNKQKTSFSKPGTCLIGGKQRFAFQNIVFIYMYFQIIVLQAFC
jgi:hypothetical protein